MAPNIASEVQSRRAKAGAQYPLLLKGLAIGDGWVDPEEQNLSFGPFAYSAGLIGQSQLAEMDGGPAKSARLRLRGGKYMEALNTYCYYNLLNNITAWGGGVSPYDIRKFGGASSDGGVRLAGRVKTPSAGWLSSASSSPPDLASYLDRPDVRQALNVPASYAPWGANAGAVETAHP